MDEGEESSDLASESSSIIARIVDEVMQLGLAAGEESTDRDDSEESSEDGRRSPATPPAKRRKPPPSGGPKVGKHDVKWGKIGEGGARERQAFCGVPGVNCFPPVTRQGVVEPPLVYFRMTLTEDMRKLIVSETNKYVAGIVAAGGAGGAAQARKWVLGWRDLTLDELDVFLGVLILKGVSHKGTEKSFWSKSPLLTRGAASHVMSRNRFMDIKRALHCQDDAEDPDSDAQLKKIGKLLNMFCDRAAEIYTPSENCSIDEMMLLFTGTSSFKFTKQAKPTRNGLKLFAVCESEMGYVLHAVLDRRGKKGVHDHVMELAHAVSGYWRTIYMDNLFVSVRTLRALLAICTYGAGTTLADRGLPKELEKKTVQLEKAGDWVFVQGDSGLLGVAWRDSDVCVGLSTRHDGLAGVVKRRVKGVRGRQERACPDLFVDYNKYMGCVDLADLRRAWHTCRLRSYKWWHPVFWWIIDSAMINAFILRNQHVRRKMKASDFWLEVVSGLFEHALNLPADADQAEIAKYTHAGKKGPSFKLGRERLFGRHYLAFRSVGDAPTIDRRCKLCMHTHKKGSTAYNRKTRAYCETCDVALHWECFKSYHEDAEPKSAFLE
jgi:hypothetical protein